MNIDFDEEFDARVIVLDRALRRLNDILRIIDDKHGDVTINRFVSVLKDTAVQSNHLANTVGELKIFIDNISVLAEEWSVAAEETETDTTMRL